MTHLKESLYKRLYERLFSSMYCIIMFWVSFRDRRPTRFEIARQLLVLVYCDRRVRSRYLPATSLYLFNEEHSRNLDQIQWVTMAHEEIHASRSQFAKIIGSNSRRWQKHREKHRTEPKPRLGPTTAALVISVVVVTKSRFVSWSDSWRSNWDWVVWIWCTIN